MNSEAEEGVPQAVRDEIFQKVKRKVEKRTGENAARSCLYWAWFGGLELRRHGFHPLFQAGNAKWPRIEMAKIDDYPPTELTHFAYEWAPRDPLSIMAVAAGHLPEMHIWLGLPETQTLIDFSTGAWPEAFGRFGKTWPGPKPPPYLWVPADQQPEHVYYNPVLTACVYVDRLVAQMIAEGRLTGD